MPARLSEVSLWGDGKRLQTQVAPVAADTLTIRSLDWDRDRFDIEFGLQNGTTYNSYLIFGEHKTALVDASHEKFREAYMPVLLGELAARGRGLDYVFVSHTEPDHSGEAGVAPAAAPAEMRGLCPLPLATGRAQQSVLSECRDWHREWSLRGHRVGKA